VWTSKHLGENITEENSAESNGLKTKVTLSLSSNDRQGEPFSFILLHFKETNSGEWGSEIEIGILKI